MSGNHRSGRRPKPTAEKRAAGNPGKRKLGAEPVFDPALIGEPPAWLGTQGQAEWRRIVPQLLREKSALSVDIPTLEGYCASYQLALECEAAITKQGLSWLTEKGELQKHPLLGVKAQAWKDVRAFASEFGLTPATRPKVAKPARDAADPLADFANQRNET